MVTRSKAGIHKPKLPYVGMVNTEANSAVEPSNVKEALQSNIWKKAMEEEFNALMKIKPRNWFLISKIRKLSIVDGCLNTR